jgi:hypothetical protein
MVPGETNPKVRALLVLAAGVHLQDDPLLLACLDDRSPVVRRAAVLAAGHAEGGAEREEILPGVAVLLGRDLPAGTADALSMRRAVEEDEGARGTLRRVLNR